MMVAKALSVINESRLFYWQKSIFDLGVDIYRVRNYISHTPSTRKQETKQ
jgi:hypothetical protein